MIIIIIIIIIFFKREKQWPKIVFVCIYSFFFKISYVPFE